MFMPFSILGIWFRGLFTLALLAAAVFCLAEWYLIRDDGPIVIATIPKEPSVSEVLPDASARETQDDFTVRTIAAKYLAFDKSTAYLVGGIVLLAMSFGGNWIGSPLLFRQGSLKTPQLRGGQVEYLPLSDGSRIKLIAYGPLDGDRIIMTHGWGLSSEEWCYLPAEWVAKYRVILWDLPGLGGSDRPADRDWSQEKLARTLDAIITSTGNKPVVLLGHSIGVMITLTYCKLFLSTLGTRVRGLVLVQSTYTNPVKTTSMAGLYTAIQKPVIEPLCHLMVWLSPVFRALNWLSYFNGSAHRSTEKGSFSGHETRGQLEFMSRFYCKSAPDVVARGMLGMLKYDATDVLKKIPIPTLVIAGDKDKVCLPEASIHMARTIPTAELYLLKQSRHCGLFEHHEEFYRATSAFLKTLKSSMPGVATPHFLDRETVVASQKPVDSAPTI